MKVTIGKDTSGRPLVVDRQVLRMLHEAGRRLGFALVIVQGSYMAGRGAPASATTHNKAGVVDIRVGWGLPKRTTPEDVNLVLRKVGFAAWVRDEKHGGMAPHIHAIAIGMQGLDPAAARQVVDYLNGLDGLAGRHPDYNERPDRIRTWAEVKRLMLRRRYLADHPGLMASVEGYHSGLMASVEGSERRLRRFLRRHPKIARQWLALGGHS